MNSKNIFSYFFTLLNTFVWCSMFTQLNVHFQCVLFDCHLMLMVSIYHCHCGYNSKITNTNNWTCIQEIEFDVYKGWNVINVQFCLRLFCRSKQVLDRYFNYNISDWK